MNQKDISMASSQESSDKITPPVLSSINILLPVCVESNYNVFVNLLRNIVNRSRMDAILLSNYNALKSGMSKTFAIDFEDIDTNWKKRKTKSQQVCQSKMLGFWAVKNFPSLGKKLFGNSWKPHQRKSIDVQKKSMTPEEIDDVIFRKMELRVIKLRVQKSTALSLKYFINVPKTIAKYNAVTITPKIISFNIGSEALQFYWDELKRGDFLSCKSMNVEQPESLIVPLATLSIVSPENDEQTASDGNSFEMAKRPRLDRSANNDVTAYTFDDSDDSTVGSFRMALLELRKDVGKIANRIDRNVCLHENEECYTTERLHVIIIKQKDDLIAEMKLSAKLLQNEIEYLKNENSNLNTRMNSKISLISALQKGVEANFQLHKKSEADLTVSIDLADSYKQTIARHELSISTFKSELRMLKDKMLVSNLPSPIPTENLPGANNMNNELGQKNRKLAEELTVWKNIAENKEKDFEDLNETVKLHSNDNIELRVQLNNENSLAAELRGRIQDLETNVSEKTAIIEKLYAELTETKNGAEKKEKELEEVNQMVKSLSDGNSELRVQRINNVDSFPQSINEVENIDTNLSEITALTPPKAFESEDITKNQVLTCDADCVSVEMLENRNVSQIGVTVSKPKDSFEIEKDEFNVQQRCDELKKINSKQCISNGIFYDLSHRTRKYYS